MTNFKLLVALVMVVAVIGSSSLAQAQEKDDCVKTTKPCFKDENLKGEVPGLECCDPLKAAVKNSLVCVCSIFGDTQFLNLLKIDSNATLSLPKRCGIDLDLVTGCKAALAPPAPSPASDQPAASPIGPASPSAPTTTVTTTPGPSDGKNAASNMALSAVTMLSSFLIWATMML